jgi:hypothetical protein
MNTLRWRCINPLSASALRHPMSERRGGLRVTAFFASAGLGDRIARLTQRPKSRDVDSRGTPSVGSNYT